MKSFLALLSLLLPLTALVPNADAAGSGTLERMTKKGG